MPLPRAAGVKHCLLKTLFGGLPGAVERARNDIGHDALLALRLSQAVAQMPVWVCGGGSASSC